MKKYLRVLIMMLSVQLCYAQKQEWKSLFNGRNLDGWDTYLRATDMSGYYLDSTKTYLPPIGVNKDPLKVFTIVNNAIRVSGEIWGAFTSKAQYSNYHIRFQTKWGVKKWPPRDGDDVYRDRILFHCSGPFDYAFNCWMRSLEFNIQEGEFGDFTDVHAGMPELRTSPGKTLKGKDIDQYDMSGVSPGQPAADHTGRVILKAPMANGLPTKRSSVRQMPYL